MSLFEKTIAIAVEAHQGKKDKGGQPYILHPLRVMFRMDFLLENLPMTPDEIEACR